MDDCMLNVVKWFMFFFYIWFEIKVKMVYQILVM